MLSLETVRWSNSPSAFKLSYKKCMCLFSAEKKNKLESQCDNLLCKREKVAFRGNPLRRDIELIRPQTIPANHTTKTDRLRSAHHCKTQQVILNMLFKTRRQKSTKQQLESEFQEQMKERDM